MEIKRLASYRAQPWKNGRGQTLEIDRDPAEPYGYRLSLATIAGPGPFSPFAGYDRILTLIAGGPVTLECEGKQRILPRLEPFAFDGGLATAAVEPTAPSEDLNVFAARNIWRAAARVLHFEPNDNQRLAADGQRHYLFVVDGEIQTDKGLIAPRDTLVVTGHADVALRPRTRAHAIWVELFGL